MAGIYETKIVAGEEIVDKEDRKYAREWSRTKASPSRILSKCSSIHKGSEEERPRSFPLWKPWRVHSEVTRRRISSWKSRFSLPFSFSIRLEQPGPHAALESRVKRVPIGRYSCDRFCSTTTVRFNAAAEKSDRTFGLPIAKLVLARKNAFVCPPCLHRPLNATRRGRIPIKRASRMKKKKKKKGKIEREKEEEERKEGAMTAIQRNNSCSRSEPINGKLFSANFEDNGSDKWKKYWFSWKLALTGPWLSV